MQYKTINDISELEGLYGEPAPASIGKVVNELTTQNLLVIIHFR